MIQLYYFGKVEETLGKSAEQIALPPDINTVIQLRAWLSQRDTAWATLSTVHGAVNHTHANADTEIRDGDEVAFFSPISGG
jgi:molybdopterin synthase sulfur carrier subunit